MLKNINLGEVLRVLLATIAFIAVVIVTKKLIIEKVFSSIFSGNEVYKYFQAVFMIAFQITVYYFVFKFIEQRQIYELSRDNIFKTLSIGFIIGITTMAISVVVLMALKKLSFQPTGNPVFITIIKTLIYFSLFALFEELVFRGIVQNNLQKVFGLNISILISASIFALAHLSNTDTTVFSFSAVFIGGAILGVMYSITNTIWLSYSFHVGWNFLQGILGLDVSGVEGITSLFSAKLTGGAILSGGKFGIEASIITILFTGLLFIVLYTYKIRNLFM